MGGEEGTVILSASWPNGSRALSGTTRSPLLALNFPEGQKNVCLSIEKGKHRKRCVVSSLALKGERGRETEPRSGNGSLAATFLLQRGQGRALPRTGGTCPLCQSLLSIPKRSACRGLPGLSPRELSRLKTPPFPQRLLY